MTYCTKCGKPTDNGIMCKDCMILDSPWLSAMNRKENDLIEQIEQLKAENAALRERLSRAVELPCKVGDKVYCIHGMSNPEMLEWQVNEIRITDHNYMLQLGRAGTKDYRNEASQFYGKWWFTELEAALARLAELEGKEE